MRCSTLIPVVALSIVALMSACATSPYEGLGADVQDTKAAEPTPASNSATLPPKTSTSPADAGAAVDAAKPDSGASSSGTSGTSGSSGSSGTSGSSGSSGSSGTSSSSGGTGAACDVSNPLNLLLYQLEVSSQASAVPCPCAAGECCYLGVTCIAP